MVSPKGIQENNSLQTSDLGSTTPIEISLKQETPIQKSKVSQST